MLGNPFTVDPPSRVDIASGWRAALTLPDGTVIARARVLWPLSADAQVLDRGRVEVRIRVNGGAWRDLPAVAGAEDGAMVTPANVGDTLIAQARFVKLSGRASTWVQSGPHVVIDPIASERTATRDSASAGWGGVMSGASIVQEQERVLAGSDSWRDGFVGEAAGVQTVQQYRVESTGLHDSLRDGWRGVGQGCATQPI